MRVNCAGSAGDADSDLHESRDLTFAHEAKQASEFVRCCTLRAFASLAPLRESAAFLIR